MGRCQLCKERVEIPFKCNYCGQLFCAEHRLPEKHLCPALPIKREWSIYKKIRGQKWGLKEEPKKVPFPYSSKDSKKTSQSFHPDDTKNRAFPLFILLVIIGIAGYIVYDTLFGESYFSYEFACESFSVKPDMPWVNESILIQFNIRNKGNKNDTRCIDVLFNGESIDAFNLFLQPNNETYFQYTFNNMNIGEHFFEINGLNNTFNHTITVNKPDTSVLERKDYYYQFAEQYVKQTYFVPKDKSVKELAKFLDALNFPEYQEKIFDCTDSSALLEWLLEGAGYNAYLVDNDSHMWAQVETDEGIIAIEATSLCKGDNYYPPGIVERSDGKFLEYTADFRGFLEWKKKYPASKYDYDPNISFNEWTREYVLEIPTFGIPTNDEYYKKSSRYESPDILYIGETVENVHTYMEEIEFNWWDAEPFDSLSPFSYW